jgi:hypothetical protein
MTNRRMTRMSLVVVMSAVPLALSSVSAAAATGPSRGTGLIGGCNMLRDATMLPGTGGAMDHDSAQGTTGMFIGVAASGDPFCQ